MHYTLNGWHACVLLELKSFYSRRDELTIEGNCLLWGGPSGCAHQVETEGLE